MAPCRQLSLCPAPLGSTRPNLSLPVTHSLLLPSCPPRSDPAYAGLSEDRPQRSVRPNRQYSADIYATPDCLPGEQRGCVLSLPMCHLLFSVTSLAPRVVTRCLPGASTQSWYGLSVGDAKGRERERVCVVWHACIWSA